MPYPSSTYLGELGRLKTYLENKGKSKQTIIDYEYLFKIAWVNIEDLSDIKRINEWLMQADVATSTKHAISSVLRNYYKSLGLKEQSKKIESIYYKSKECKHTVSEEELNKMIDVADERDKLALQLMFFTGMRRGILLNLIPSMLKDGGIDVPEDIKGNKMKQSFFIPMPQTLYQQLLEFVESRKISKEKKIFDYQYKRDEDFTRKIKYIAKIAALPSWISPHRFRHGFASDFIMRGGRKEILQMNLGQKDPRATERYVHANKEMQKKETEKLYKETKETM